MPIMPNAAVLLAGGDPEVLGSTSRAHVDCVAQHGEGKSPRRSMRGARSGPTPSAPNFCAPPRSHRYQRAMIRLGGSPLDPRLTSHLVSPFQHAGSIPRRAGG